jgi:hypothetical protein
MVDGMASLEDLRSELGRIGALADRSVCHSLAVIVSGPDLCRDPYTPTTEIRRCYRPTGHDGEHDYDLPQDLRVFLDTHAPAVLAHLDHCHQRVREMERLLARDRYPWPEATASWCSTPEPYEPRTLTPEQERICEAVGRADPEVP